MGTAAGHFFLWKAGRLVAWIDDRAWAHPKITELSDGAFRLWVSSICYASGFGTRGKLTPEQQRKIGVSRVTSEELLCHGLWIEGNNFITIRDWEEHNGVRDRKREQDRIRKRKQREREKDVTRDNPRDGLRDIATLKSDRVTSDGRSTPTPSAKAGANARRFGAGFAHADEADEHVAEHSGVWLPPVDEAVGW